MKTFIFALNLLSVVWIVCGTGPIGYYTKDDGISSTFSYDPEAPNGPEYWYTLAPMCGGASQSPINIETSAVISSVELPEISSTRWDETPDLITVENNGHSVKFEFEYANGSMPVIIVNDSEYEFSQLHYHFGYDSNCGSEHTINDVAYAMEGHAVFFRREYGTFTDAVSYPDGLTVIGRLYNENQYYTDININFDFLSYIRSPEEVHVLSSYSELFSLEDIMGPLNCGYYTYQGSLTTPECNEVVTWVVLAEPIKISSESLFEFREVYGYEGLMANNFRPVQDLNGRPVFCSQ